jgi:hypothetical protein
MKAAGAKPSTSSAPMSLPSDVCEAWEMTMSEHEVLSREQWAIARKVFLAREKEFGELADNMQISALTIFRHPGESRDPLNSRHAGCAAQISLIQGGPAFAGMTNHERRDDAVTTEARA